MTTTVKNPVKVKDTVLEQLDKYKQESSKYTSNAPKSDQSSNDSDITEEIEKLHNLKEKGVITEEEFKQRKTKILNS